MASPGVSEEPGPAARLGCFIPPSGEGCIYTQHTRLCPVRFENTELLLETAPQSPDGMGGSGTPCDGLRGRTAVRRETGRLGLATNGCQAPGCGMRRTARVAAPGRGRRACWPGEPTAECALEVQGPAEALRWHATNAVRSVEKRASHCLEVNSF